MPERNRWLRSGLRYAALAFILSLLLSYVANIFLRQAVFLLLEFLVLLLVILLGVVADMIGFAAAAADVTPLHARAANRVLGARQAVRLVRNADQVAVFCSDVMGDISSTLAGAMGAVIVIRLITQPLPSPGWYTIMMTALVTAVTVGGKALGKGIALREATEIMFRMGRGVAWVERLTGYELFGSVKNVPRGSRFETGTRNSGRGSKGKD
jgi:hypothetical protein